MDDVDELELFDEEDSVAFTGQNESPFAIRLPRSSPPAPVKPPGPAVTAAADPWDPRRFPTRNDPSQPSQSSAPPVPPHHDTAPRRAVRGGRGVAGGDAAEPHGRPSGAGAAFARQKPPAAAPAFHGDDEDCLDLEGEEVDPLSQFSVPKPPGVAPRPAVTAPALRPPPPQPRSASTAAAPTPPHPPVGLRGAAGRFLPAGHAVPASQRRAVPLPASSYGGSRPRPPAAVPSAAAASGPYATVERPAPPPSQRRRAPASQHPPVAPAPHQPPSATGTAGRSGAGAVVASASQAGPQPGGSITQFLQRVHQAEAAAAVAPDTGVGAGAGAGVGGAVPGGGGGGGGGKRRRIPGPAGLLALKHDAPALPPAVGTQDIMTTQQRNRWRTAHMPSGIADSLFFKGPWCTMCEALGIPLPQPVILQPGESFNVEVQHLSSPQARFVANRDDILAHPMMCNSVAFLTKARSLRAVRQLVVVIKALVPYDTDLMAEVVDIGGEMVGCVHRRVLEEYGSEFNVGSAVILKKVSVFSPSPDSHYLNIVPANIARVFPPWTPLPSCMEGMSMPPSS